MKDAREKTRATKAEVAEQTALLAQKTAEQVAAREALVAQQNALAAARTSTSRASSRECARAVTPPRRTSRTCRPRARRSPRRSVGQLGGSGGGSSGNGSSSSGLIWPVNGVVTSGFGWRWGRMHEGIDIGASSGTPIRAAAAGTVIFAGWMGGYRNLVIIDHGNGLATAYGHQSAIYVGGGSISQGTVIGAVGSTGNSTGPHLQPGARQRLAVDPLGYL